MKRILTLGLALLALCNITHAATLKIATLAPDGTTWMKLMREAASEIKAETDGRVKIKYFPGGVQGSDKSVLRKMRIRQLQGGAISSGSLSDISNMVQLYSLPFTFRTVEELRAVREEFDPLIKEALYDKGYVVLGLAEGGFAYLMSDRALRSVDDFRSQKVWVPEGDQISATVFDKAEIEPISLPISDVYTSLQTGLINTIGANLSSAIALQWHSKISHVTDFPLLFITGLLIVDKGAFEKLSGPDQQVVKDIMSRTFLKMDEQNARDDQGARQAMSDNGIEFVALSDEEKANWRELASESLQALASRGVYPTGAYERLQQRLQALRGAE